MSLNGQISPNHILNDHDDETFSAMPSTSANTLDVPIIRSRNTISEKESHSTVKHHQMQAKEEGLGGVLVISGGSGYNDLVGATPGATYVMPISDDGGSSSEIIRVLGGPSIGDLRSRLIRLIPTTTSYHGEKPPASNDALHALLSYRLPVHGKSREIKQEWMDILEGRHRLWRGIEPERKECIRGFLVYFESEILRRVHRNFSFKGASIGNFFLAAAQKFFRSIQSAIFLFSSTCLIPQSEGKVLPVINTNHTATIAAILEDGKVIVGQCEISHPATKRKGDEIDNLSLKSKHWRAQLSGIQTPSSQIFDPFQTTSLSSSRLTVGNMGDGLDPGSESDVDGEGDDDENSDGNTNTGGRASLTSPNLNEPPPKRQKRVNNIVFSKTDHSSITIGNGPSKSDQSNGLPSKISRLFYVNAYGSEVDPAPNPEYLNKLSQVQTLLFSCGSLWTSIIPCLALRGIAKSILQSSTLRYKILVLNTISDRETFGFDAMDFVRVIINSMKHYDQIFDDQIQFSKFISHIIYSPQGQIQINVDQMKSHGIQCVPVELPLDRLQFDEINLRKALDKIVENDR